MSAFWIAQYVQSKYIREDNTRANALYLGYLDARELYPDLKPIPFEQYFKEAIEGDLEGPWARSRALRSGVP
jgi:hypothetical protein